MTKMGKSVGIRIAVTLLLVSLGVASAAIPVDKKVVGYLPSYRLDTLPSINWGNLTHVCYFSLDADVNGNLLADSTFAMGLPQVVSQVHNAGKKVSVCVGGWLTDGYFSPIANSTVARINFVNQLVAYCRNNKLDGVDLDWEPVADADVGAYTTLIADLRAGLSPYGLLLSVAVNSKHYDVLPAVGANVDWVAVRAYDMNYPHADHSTYADTVASMTFWTQSGIDKSKLLMGVPFFGLNEGWSNALTYAEIINLYNPSADLNDAGGYGFNGMTLISNKTVYALGSGFGGMMIWELGQDKFDNRSLLATLATAMGATPPPALPAPWMTADVGSVGLVGNATQLNGVWTVSGVGPGVGLRSDAFRFVYQTLSGDGEIVARVPSQSSTASSAEAGVMIRESLNANARCAFMKVSPTKYYSFEVRTSTGGKSSNSTAGTVNPAPNNWVRLVRTGSTITAYKSADGVTWVKVKSVSVTMAANVYIGFAVDSGSTSSLNTAGFDKISVMP